MRFFLPFTAALAGLAAATPITNDLAKRDANDVISAVQAIGSSMITLNTTVSSYNGGLLGTGTALKIQAQCTSLAATLQGAVWTTQLSANFTNDESVSVALAVLTLEPQIFSTLDNIVAHKPQFDTGLLGVSSLSFLVEADLKQQAGLAADLGAAIQAKLTGTYAQIAPFINNAIAAKFAATLAVFD